MSADTREHAHGDGAVLACGAYLKNRACLVQAHDAPQWSAVQGDLGDPANCRALDASIEQLLSKATVPVHAIAHDL
ncbi:carbamoyltransferase HypF, partial [Staphylococcus gallinarum]